MRVAIIGTGHVGLVTGVCFADVGHEVICQDVDRHKIQMLDQGRLPFLEPQLDVLFEAYRSRLRFTGSLRECVAEAEVLFVCVGTPPGTRGESNLKYVEKVARELADLLQPGQYRLIVDKSTVPVKTAERVERTMRLYAPAEASFGVASNPEFLREGAAVADTLKPDRIVVGTSSTRDRDLLREVYRPFTTQGYPLIETNVRSAELIKHVANSFLAMKLSFVNLVARICDATEASVDEVLHGIGFDVRIGTAFLRPGIGYGGSCFPKDVPAFAHIAGELGIDASLLWAVHDLNLEQPGWFVQRMQDALWTLADKRIAVWGLAFKHDTDDVRESPAIKVVRLLLDAGAHVVATDPVAIDRAKDVLSDDSGVLPAQLEFQHDPLICCEDAEALVVATEWPHFRSLSPDEALQRMRLPLVFDGKNTLDPATWRAAGARYIGVGRPE